MSAPLLLRAFVKDRLTAAAVEICQVFEKTIEKYEEEASSSKQEIERLRGLLLEFESSHKHGLFIIIIIITIMIIRPERRGAYGNCTDYYSN